MSCISGPASCEGVFTQYSNLPANASYIEALSHGTTIFTGGNRGLGKELAKYVARIGGHVVIAARSIFSAKQAAHDIEDYCQGHKKQAHVFTFQVDLSSLTSVKGFCDEILEKIADLTLHPVRCVVFSAGIRAFRSKKQIVTYDGIEKLFQVNFLSAFVIQHFICSSVANGQNRNDNFVKSIFIVDKFNKRYCRNYAQKYFFSDWDIWRKIVKPGYVEKSTTDFRYKASKFSCLLFTESQTAVNNAQGINNFFICVFPGFTLQTNFYFDSANSYFLDGLNSSSRITRFKSNVKRIFRNISRFKTSCYFYFSGSTLGTVDSVAANVLKAILMPRENCQGKYFTPSKAISLDQYCTDDGEPSRSLLKVCNRILTLLLKQDEQGDQLDL